MGFSRGGIVTMLASTTWSKENFAGQPSFRAFFAFYPYCNTIFPERDRVSAPVRIHTGAADDWTPAEPCGDLAASLKAAGQDISISVYPDAYHLFDQATDNVFLPNVAISAIPPARRGCRRPPGPTRSTRPTLRRSASTGVSIDEATPTLCSERGTPIADGRAKNSGHSRPGGPAGKQSQLER